MEETKSAAKNLTSFLALISILFFSWLLGRYFNIDIDYLRKILSKLPLVYSGVIFILLYVAISFFIWFSKDIFRVLAALIFGAYLSTIFVSIAEMINATILFNLSRFLGRDFVKLHLKGNFADLDKRIDKSGFWGIFALRIVPLVPFRFLDVATGLTGISFRVYLLICALGSPLRIFWLQFILAAVGLSIFKDTKMLTDYFLKNRIIFVFSLIYLIAAIIVGFFLKRSLLDRKEDK